jgi:site-specific recombinase XerD
MSLSIKNKNKMVKEQKISFLIESCSNALKEEGYSESNIVKHRKCWKKLSEYMEEHSIINYSADVGERFLDTVLKNHISYKRSFRRSIYLLTDYPSFGMIRARIVQYANHELPGEIGEVAKRFMASLITKRYKQSTLKEYQRILSYFIKNLTFKSVNYPSDIRESEVLSFISSTQNCKKNFLIVMRSFCRYLYEQKIVEHNIGYVIGKDNYPVREKLSSVYEAKEIKQIEDAVDRSTAVGKRDYAMLLLTTRLGLRVSDVAGLQFESLDWENNVIRLSQYKTKQDLELPLLTDVGEAIIDYLKSGRPILPSPNVFLSACAPYRSANSMIVEGAIRRIITSSKVCIRNRKSGPHAMRHSLASQLLYNGTPLPVISETLGHADTQTTMEYLRIDFKNLMSCTLEVPAVSEEFYLQKGRMFYE